MITHRATGTRLARVGNVVHEGYRHVTKRISPGAPFVLPDVYLKWYDLRGADQAVDPACDGTV
jgi:hypothetical protein